MTHPLTPREKVELKPCPFCGGEAWLNDYEAKYSDLPPKSRCPQCRSCGASLGYLTTPAKATEAWNRRTALASGSGDHAELARVTSYVAHAREIRQGAILVSTGDLESLLAENAALRGEAGLADVLGEKLERRTFALDEVERKLAEAVGLLREWMGTWFVDANSRGEIAIADDTRKFLSKEAERG